MQEAQPIVRYPLTSNLNDATATYADLIAKDAGRHEPSVRGRVLVTVAVVPAAQRRLAPSRVEQQRSG